MIPSFLRLKLSKLLINLLTVKLGKKVGLCQYKTKQCKRQYANYLSNYQCKINDAILVLFYKIVAQLQWNFRTFKINIISTRECITEQNGIKDAERYKTINKLFRADRIIYLQ
jgi:hypothetical protein